MALSAKTPMLEVTPAPYGRPGGPGLYRLKGNSHSPYFENVVRALMTKRGMSKGQASAVAWGALRRWRAKSKHPEVRTAASAGLMQEAAAAAKARAAHAHSVTWDDVACVVDLAVVNVKTYQRTVNTPQGPRVQTIVQHPQNYRSGMGQQAAGGSGGRPAAAATAPAGQPQASSRAQQKQQLLAKAAADRRQAVILGIQEYAYYQALQNALYGKNTTKAQAGATTGTQAGATTGAQAGATTAAQAGATTPGSATPASVGLSASQVSQIQASAAQAAAALPATQLQADVNRMQAQISALYAQAAAWTAQAAKL